MMRRCILAGLFALAAFAAQRLMRAVEAVTARGDVLTPDLGGSATTAQVTDAVIAALAGANA
jgi:tartrate dehydrogenase/decarboxylase/D-malate dehydrogenase